MTSHPNIYVFVGTPAERATCYTVPLVDALTAIRAEANLQN